MNWTSYIHSAAACLKTQTAFRYQGRRCLPWRRRVELDQASAILDLAGLTVRQKLTWMILKRIVLIHGEHSRKSIFRGCCCSISEAAWSSKNRNRLIWYTKSSLSRKRSRWSSAVGRTTSKLKTLTLGFSPFNWKLSEIPRFLPEP